MFCNTMFEKVQHDSSMFRDFTCVNETVAHVVSRNLMIITQYINSLFIKSICWQMLLDLLCNKENSTLSVFVSWFIEPQIQTCKSGCSFICIWVDSDWLPRLPLNLCYVNDATKHTHMKLLLFQLHAVVSFRIPTAEWANQRKTSLHCLDHCSWMVPVW